MEIETQTQTPIGKFVVNVDKRRVVHILRTDESFSPGGCPILNQNKIVFWGELFGPEGSFHQGWTSLITIPEPLMHKITSPDCLFFLDKDKAKLFDVRTGVML